MTNLKLKLKKIAFDENKEFYFAAKIYLQAGFKDTCSLISILRTSKTKEELKIMCTTPDSLEFTRELVYRGIHLETLSIDYPYINDKIINDKMMETLTAIIEQNRCNSLSAIHFRHIGAINVSQATKEALKKVLLESEIVLDDGFLKELYPEDFHPAKTPQKAKND